MYEAKFIMGAIAGAMSEHDKIAYIADYPIYGTIANINAFALGAKMTNPRAQIHLLWRCLKDFDFDQQLSDLQPDCVSDHDLSVPEAGSRYYGLYKMYSDSVWNLAIPVYHWGPFYTQLVRSILDGTWTVSYTHLAPSNQTAESQTAKTISVVAESGAQDGTCNAKITSERKIKFSDSYKEIKKYEDKQYDTVDGDYKLSLIHI